MNDLRWYMVGGLIALALVSWHDWTQTQKLKYAYEHPQIKEIVRTVTKNNIVTNERVVKQKDGSEITTRTITDKSGAETDLSHSSTPVLPPSQKSFSVGAGIDLQENKYLLVGGNLFFLDIFVTHRVLPLPDKLNPCVWASFNISY